MDSKKEKLLKKAYDEYIDLMLYDFPIEKISEIAVNDVTGYGTTLDEKVLEIKRLKKIVTDQREQGAGLEMQISIMPVYRRISPDEDTAIYMDEFEISMVVDGNKNVIPVRLSSVFEFSNNTWKLVHLHGSKAVETEEDTWHLNEWKQKSEQLQKLVDEKTAELLKQNRELEIEAALERVRATSMAMHKSEELVQVVRILDKAILGLGVEVNGSQIITDFTHPEEGVNVWYAREGQGFLEKFHIPYLEHPLTKRVYNAMQNGIDFYTDNYSKDEKNKYFRLLFKYSDFGKISKERKEFIFHSPAWIRAVVVSKNSILVFQRFDLKEFTKEEEGIFKRFGKVFEQAYTRFLDLQKAEAQARESQIEAALERIRSRSMAMHQTSELSEVIIVLFKQFELLDLLVDTCYIDIFDQNNQAYNLWIGTGTAVYPEQVTLPYFDHPLIQLNKKARQNGLEFFTFDEDKKSKDKYFEHFYPNAKGINVPEKRREHIAKGIGIAGSVALGQHSGITILNYQKIIYSSEENDILIRINKVFQQTYTRFLDLQRAEAQAREAQIEAALERIRARTMAMHKSDELAETAAILFQQMTELGVTPERLNICLIKEADKILEVWATDQQGIKISHHFNASLDEPTTGKRVFDAWKEKKRSVVIDLSGKELNDWIRYVREVMGMTIKAELVKEHRIHSVAFFSQGMILTTTSEPLPKESIKLLERFADVFNLTYRRFLDLQKAEEQAREAQIETALERVRSRTMGMQKSEELAEVIAQINAEITNLGIRSDNTGIMTDIRFNDKLGSYCMWFSIPGKTYSNKFQLPNMQDPLYEAMYLAYQKKIEFYTLSFSKEEKNKYLKIAFKESDLKLLPDARKEFLLNAPGWSLTVILQKNSGLALQRFKDEAFTDQENAVAIRFGRVFEQTYTRFLDLQKAEQQLREAVKQASLDRVRGEIASMRTKDDLDQITPLIWKELIALGVPFIRCGVFIMDDVKRVVHSYLSTPDGKSLSAFEMSFDDEGIANVIAEYWKKEKIYKEFWDKSQFLDFMNTLIDQGKVDKPESYQGSAPPPESLYLNFVPFKQGMLYVGNTSALEQEELELVMSLADSFSIAYARYEDFRQLEEAKNQIEKTFTELKAAQSQLIQNEKMASLGELTAGIAHEIQNPLNFVNNFSEISSELIDEMHEELDKGDIVEAKAISTDIKQNLEKINLHGKRADAIVKGMLQHSRTSTGKKELTDINALADEYLRLAYHGLRAKDKTFNADFKLEADDSLPKINVIPQDIGRVLLNLINNGFYACTERTRSAVSEARSSKQEGGSKNYKPEVIVSSKKSGDKIEIRVVDNGNGIPASLVDKIFQPFFTTKPTGSGTGLGLSLSYDIVKAHGGELTVETEEGEGSEFLIQLPIY